jgi:hypothetical protein
MTKLSNGWMTFTDLMSQRPSKDTKASAPDTPEGVPSEQPRQEPQPGSVAAPREHKSGKPSSGSAGASGTAESVGGELPAWFTRSRRHPAYKDILCLLTGGEEWSPSRQSAPIPAAEPAGYGRTGLRLTYMGDVALMIRRWLEGRGERRDVVAAERGACLQLDPIRSRRANRGLR